MQLVSHTASRGGPGAHPTCRPSRGPVGWDAPPWDPFRKTRATACCRRCPWAAGHKWPCDQGGGLPGDRHKVVRWGNRAENTPQPHPRRPKPWGSPRPLSAKRRKWVSRGRPIPGAQGKVLQLRSGDPAAGGRASSESGGHSARRRLEATSPRPTAFRGSAPQLAPGPSRKRCGPHPGAWPSPARQRPPSAGVTGRGETWTHWPG